VVRTAESTRCTVGPGANAAAAAIVDGIQNGNSSRVLTFTALSFSPNAPTFQVREPEAPEQFMSWGQLFGIFSSTKAPESARLFASWITSRDWQSQSASTRPTILESLNAQSGNGITSNNTQITKYVSFMHDRAEVEWWRFQVESIVGLVQGEYPL
jgi:ABC-type glycerol-3-phosphate transport system substrate-binding protein